MVVKNGMAHVQAGGVVVADSTPDGEYQETLNKSRALLAALEAAHLSKSGATATMARRKKARARRGRRKLK
jgi:anthranilate synthase component 1